MKPDFYYLTTLDLYEWTKGEIILTTTLPKLRTVSAFKRSRPSEENAGIQVRSHVSGKEYKFYYKDYINHADVNLNEGPGYWIYMSEDYECPVKYLKVLDK